MPIVTTIAGLSQTAASNGPDGSVDPPSSLDDQDRYHGSFIAMLRDGVGFAAGAIPTALGFTPVRQGGQSSGSTNVVSIGWNATIGKLVMAVDGNQFNNTWPIDSSTALAIRNTGVAGGTPMTFSWRDPGAIPGYLWGGDSPGDMYLTPPGRLSVNYASSAGYANSAGSAPANGGTSQNSNQVSGIGGWAYTNHGNNPAYLWATEGDGQAQHLTQPGALNVNYANSAGSASYATSAGSAPANGGTATNSNQLGGRDAGGWVQNSGGLGQLGLSSFNLVNGAYIWTATNVSDRAAKENLAPTQEDSLAKLRQIGFKEFTYKAEFKDYGVGLQKLGVVAQDLQAIDPQWIVDAPGSLLHPSQYNLLMAGLHAIQQLSEQVRALRGKVESLTE